MGWGVSGGVVMSWKRSRKEMNPGEGNYPWSCWWEDEDGGERKVTERLKAFKGWCKCKKVLFTCSLFISTACFFFFNLQLYYTFPTLCTPSKNPTENKTDANILSLGLATGFQTLRKVPKPMTFQFSQCPYRFLFL